jgi:predicted ester cyclase
MDESREQLERNKAVVIRFNREVIAKYDERAFHEIVAPDFVNRTAAPGLSPGPDGMIQMINGILRAALPDLDVEIHEQVAERDLVTTRKTLRGTHRGALFGIPPTGRLIAIEVMDMVRIRDGKYAEHWGINTLQAVLAQLRQR